MFTTTANRAIHAILISRTTPRAYSVALCPVGRSSERAFERAKKADRTYVIVIKVHPHEWTPGDAWWDVGVPQVSQREAVLKSSAEHEKGRGKQRFVF